MKPKIYWWLLQLDKLGGTEMVSINFMNNLLDDFDITIISSSVVNKCAYNIDPRIKIMSIGMPNDVTTIDQSLRIYKQQKQCKSWWKCVFNALKWVIFKRYSIKKQVQELILKDDATLVCSSIESYWLAPKKGRVFFHFHFNSDQYLKGVNRLVLNLTRKPDKTIFLSKEIMDICVKKHPKLEGKATYCFNPCRFTRDFTQRENKHEILYLGRFSPEKNPMLCVKVANELKQRGFPYHMTISGHGALAKPLNDYVKEHNLENNVEIIGPTTDAQNFMKNFDLMLLPSLYEGFCLTILEANSVGLPVISTPWKDCSSLVVNNGVNGYLTKDWDEKSFADEVIKVLSNNEELAQLRESSYQFNEKFQIENVVKQMIKILK